MAGWGCWGWNSPGVLFRAGESPGMLSRSRAQVSLRDGIVGCGGLVFAGGGQEDRRYWWPDFPRMLCRSGGNP